jgi:hypothetical protein
MRAEPAFVVPLPDFINLRKCFESQVTPAFRRSARPEFDSGRSAEVLDTTIEVAGLTATERPESNSGRAVSRMTHRSAFKALSQEKHNQENDILLSPLPSP